MTTRRIVVILVTFIVVSTVASPLLAIVQNRIGADPDVLRFTTFATTAGALAVFVCWPSARRAATVTRTGILSGVGLAVLLAFVLVAVLFTLNLMQGTRWPLLDPSTLPAPLAGLLALQILGVAGEEIGWRGVVQPLLERRFSVVVSGVITGLLFGLGHFYVLPAAGAVVYVVFVISAVGLSVSLAVLTARRALIPRIALATCFHWLVNSAILLLFADGDESLLWTTNLAIAAVVTAVGSLLLSAPRYRAESH